MTNHSDNDFLFAEQSYALQGAFFEVYRQLGSGFLESVYQECLEVELKSRGIPFVAQKELQLCYKGVQLKQKYVADIVCYDKILVELKATERILPAFEAQLLNYLNITQLQLGFLVNFGHWPKLEVKRLVKSR